MTVSDALLAYARLFAKSVDASAASNTGRLSFP